MNILDKLPGAVQQTPKGIQSPFANEPINSATGQQAPLANGVTSTGGSTYNNSALAAQQAANAAQLAAFNQQKGNILSSANDAAANSGLTYKSSINDLLLNSRQGQRAIDSQAEQNELAKYQGTQGVLGMVNRGITSGGVTLANKNAGTSSATDALARAYSDIGRRQLSGVGNQYAQGENAVNQAQTDFDESFNNNISKLRDSKTQIINTIVSAAQDKLGQLDASMASASLPDRINIEQEKQNIRNNAMSQLQQYDDLLNSGSQGIKATDQATRQANAVQLANQGTAAENAFQYQSETPAQLQGTGPFASTLPIFTYNRTKQQ